MTPAIAEHLARTFFLEYQALRGQLMETLADKDLAFSPGGANRPLGELCLEIGEVEQAYVESFRTFHQDFHWRHPDPAIATSVERLVAWYARLDADLTAALEAITEADATDRRIRRGAAEDAFSLPVTQQLDIYREALLIFYGKVSVYLRAMGRALPGWFAAWIA
ncbi:MAG TPA: DinB family protein [Candidatus Limnocylindrales bacterium]